MRLNVSTLKKSGSITSTCVNASFLALTLFALATAGRAQAQLAANTITPANTTIEAASASSPVSANTTASKPMIAAQQTTGKLNWNSLSPEQQTALAPLAGEWDKMDELRKKKWLGVASKYANMKPEEKLRVQERVQAWMKMTPEQRMAVRENFSNTSKKSAEQKSAQWQRYQQLSDEEKQKLAKEAKVKKTVTTIQPESKRTAPVLAPIKKGPPPAPVVSKAASQASVKP